MARESSRQMPADALTLSSLATAAIAPRLARLSCLPKTTTPTDSEYQWAMTTRDEQRAIECGVGGCCVGSGDERYGQP